MFVGRLVGRFVSAARNPAQVVLVAFTTLIAIGTLLLRLPIAVDGGAGHPGLRHALFWSTSATTVTGLGTVDVSTFSLFGELVLLGLIQIGGFGIMTIGSVLALVTTRRVGLRQRMFAQAEIGAVPHHLAGARGGHGGQPLSVEQVLVRSGVQVELEGHQNEMKVTRALTALEKKTVRLEILGSYASRGVEE